MEILNKIESYFEFKTRLVWRNVLGMSLLHIFGIYGLYLAIRRGFLELFFCMLFGFIGDTAISVGPHRLWAHKTYKAKLLMRIIVMLFYMFAGQYSIVQWTRDHRTHHKFADTDADPHNAGRGLFYSHCGWLMMKRHPDLKEKGKAIDVSDLWEDPVIRFHQKYFVLLTILIHIMLPSAFAYYILGADLKTAIFSYFFARYMISLNMLWCTNSLLHYWGYQPYNKNIMARENGLLAFFLVGEGWHNFHHTFPWDYRIGEYGKGNQLPAYIIEIFAKVGLAYDLKTASPEIIQKVLAKQNMPKNFEVPENFLDKEN